MWCIDFNIQSIICFGKKMSWTRSKFVDPVFVEFGSFVLSFHMYFQIIRFPYTLVPCNLKFGNQIPGRQTIFLEITQMASRLHDCGICDQNQYQKEHDIILRINMHLCNIGLSCMCTCSSSEKSQFDTSFTLSNL